MENVSMIWTETFAEAQVILKVMSFHFNSATPTLSYLQNN